MSGLPTDNSGQEITYFRHGESAFILLQKIVTDDGQNLVGIFKVVHKIQVAITGQYFVMCYILVGTPVC